jgi:hypothetical protein
VDQAGEFMDGQIGTLPRTVHSEKTEHGDIQSVDVMVDVPQGFAGKLAGGVGRNGREYGIGFRKGDLLIHTIN